MKCYSLLKKNRLTLVKNITKLKNIDRKKCILFDYTYVKSKNRQNSGDGLQEVTGGGWW